MIKEVVVLNILFLVFSFTPQALNVATNWVRRLECDPTVHSSCSQNNQCKLGKGSCNKDPKKCQGNLICSKQQDVGCNYDVPRCAGVTCCIDPNPENRRVPEGFIREIGFYCGRSEDYVDRKNAIDQCSKKPNCIAVSDLDCDGDLFTICEQNSKPYKNRKSCIYRKRNYYSACDTSCDNTFKKSPLHAVEGMQGTWICRGLWDDPPDVTHGGCNYWTKNTAGTVEACEQECEDSNFSKSLTSLRLSGDRVSEMEMCKDGCRKGKGLGNNNNAEIKPHIDENEDNNPDGNVGITGRSVDFEQKEGLHCTTKESKYDNLETAKNECGKISNCFAVADHNCGRPDYYHCYKMPTAIENPSTGSWCVHVKVRGNVNPKNEGTTSSSAITETPTGIAVTKTFPLVPVAIGGGGALLLICVLLACFIIRRKRNAKQSNTDENQGEYQDDDNYDSLYAEGNNTRNNQIVANRPNPEVIENPYYGGAEDGNPNDNTTNTNVQRQSQGFTTVTVVDNLYYDM